MYIYVGTNRNNMYITNNADKVSGYMTKLDHYLQVSDCFC